MLKKNRSMIISGQSVITMDDGTEKLIMTLSGNVNSDGSYNVTKTIQNRNLYTTNKETCESDYEEFDTYVSTLVDTE